MGTKRYVSSFVLIFENNEALVKINDNITVSRIYFVINYLVDRSEVKFLSGCLSKQKYVYEIIVYNTIYNKSYTKPR